MPVPAPGGPITDRIDLHGLLGPDGELTDGAIAAIEASATDGLRRLEPPATPAPSPSATSRVGMVGGLSGLGAILVAADQLLRDQGETLAKLSAEAGPLTGPLLTNWPVVLLLSALGWAVAARWRDYQEGLKARDARSIRQGKAQLKILQSVALETKHVGTEMGALRAQFGGLSGRLDAQETRTRDDVRDLRRYVDDRFTHVEHQLQTLVTHPGDPR